MIHRRAAFESWLNKTIDVKYEYDEFVGYMPQEVYQLYQAFSVGWSCGKEEG